MNTYWARSIGLLAGAVLVLCLTAAVEAKSRL